MRLARTALLAFSSLSLVSCGPSTEEAAARILNAQVTAGEFPSSTTVPNWTNFNCGSNKYVTNGGGEAKFTPTFLTETRASVLMSTKFNIFGPGIHEPTGYGTDKDSINCTVTAEYVFNPATKHVEGGGTLTDCSASSCTINGRGVDCNDLKTALAKFTCAD